MKMYKVIDAAICGIMKATETGKPSEWFVATDLDGHLWLMFGGFAAVKVPDKLDVFDLDRLAELAGKKPFKIDNMLLPDPDEIEAGYDTEVLDAAGRKLARYCEGPYYCYMGPKIHQLAQWLDDGTSGKLPLYYKRGMFRMKDQDGKVIAILMGVNGKPGMRGKDE